MRWICIKGTHVNTHRIDTFFWSDGKLWVNFAGESDTTIWDDPDRELYVKMCHLMGLRPEEDEEDGEN